MRVMDTFVWCPVCMIDSGGGMCSPDCADAFESLTESWEPSDVRMFSTNYGAFMLDLSAMRIKRLALPEHPEPRMRVAGEWFEFMDCSIPTVGKPFRVVWRVRHVGQVRVPDASRSTPVIFVASCVYCGNTNVAGPMSGHDCYFEEEHDGSGR